MSTDALPTPHLDLSPPGTFGFTVAEAIRGRRLNTFARGLRDPTRRATAADEQATLAASSLDANEVKLIQTRDWTGLMLAGGHLQLILVIAAALGDSLWDIGAHHVGCPPDLLMAECPRRVTGLPDQLRHL